jgi:hypothetical protein
MIQNLIGSEHKHLLWKDDNDDPFILTDFCEAYEYSAEIIRLLFWDSKSFKRIAGILNTFDHHKTDDPIWMCSIKVEDFSKLLKLCKSRKNRRTKAGKWIKDKEKRLAHRILPLEFLKRANSVLEVRVNSHDFHPGVGKYQEIEKMRIWPSECHYNAI